MIVQLRLGEDDAVGGLDALGYALLESIVEDRSVDLRQHDAAGDVDPRGYVLLGCVVEDRHA